LDFRADAFTAAPWSCMLAEAYLLLQCCSVCMCGSSQISNLNPWLAFVGWVWSKAFNVWETVLEAFTVQIQNGKQIILVFLSY